jgi:tetratricopeptide (TPR) repeat protein
MVPNSLAEGNYVGHQELRNRVAESLQHNKKVALHGLGGIGYVHQDYARTHVVLRFTSTSRLAAEAAEMLHREKTFNCIFWVDASSEASFKGDMESIAEYLRLEPKPNAASQTNAVKIWMEDENNGSWLLVLDAAAPEAMLENAHRGGRSSRISVDSRVSIADTPKDGFVLRLPRQASAHLRTILITTCQEDIAIRWGSIDHVFEVPFLQPEEAEHLLRERSGDGRSPKEDIASLADELDYNPSAILAAATLIRMGHDVGTTISTFLQNCRKHNNKPYALFDGKQPALTNYPIQKSLILIWSNVIEAIRETAPEACELLFLISCLARSNISFGLFRHAFKCSKSSLQQWTYQLLKYRLISSGESGDSYSMPRLVQLTVRHYMSTHPEAFESRTPLLYWHLKALRCLVKEYDSMEPATEHGFIEAQLKRRKLLPHADMFRQFCWNEKKCEIELLEDQFRAIVVFAELFSSEGRYKDAERMLAYARESPKRQSFWRDSALLRLAESLRNQYLVDRDRKKLKKALSIANEVEEREGGVASVDIFSTLALLLSEKGDFGKAKKYQTQIVAILTQDYGEDHPATIDARLELSQIHGRWGYAEHALKEQQALEHILQSKTSLGDRDTASRLCQVQAAMVRTYHRLNRWQTAVELAEAVVERRTALFGDQDMKTIGSEKDLVMCLADFNRMDEAIEILEKIEMKLRRKLGYSHPETEDCQRMLNKLLEKTTVAHGP